MHLTQKARLINELEILFALRLVEVFSPLRAACRKIGLDEVVRVIDEKGIDMSREINIILEKYDVGTNHDWLVKDLRESLYESEINFDDLPVDL